MNQIVLFWKTVLFNVCVYLDNGENEQPHPQLAPSSGIQGEMKILNEHSPPLNFGGM